MDYRVDTFVNTLASLGSMRDKSTGVRFEPRTRMSRRTLNALYEQNAYVARYVDRLADDALREGWTIKEHDGPEDLDIETILKRFRRIVEPDKTLAAATRWSRLYGAALLLVNAEDGNERNRPLDMTRVRGISKSTVIVADDAQPLTYDSALASPTYEQVLSYNITGVATITSSQIEVHHTRAIAFEPVSLPLEERLESPNGWGPSVIERVWDELAALGATRGHASGMMYAASIMFVKLKGLRNELNSAGGKERVRKILGEIRSCLDMFGLLGLDAGEDGSPADEIGSISHTYQGVHQLLEQFRDAAGDAFEAPREIMFNESPAGLNAGELSGPQEIWFARVRAYQNEVLEPALRRLIDIAFRAWDVPVTEYEIEWKSLFVESENSAELAPVLEVMRAVNAGEITREAGIALIQAIRPSLDALALFLEPAEPLVTEGTPAVEPAAEALNGAQISSLVSIVEGVVAGLIPRDAALGIIQASFPTQAARAEALLGSAGVPDPDAPAVPALPMPEDAMDVRKAASQLGMSTRTITRAIERGEIGSWKLGGRTSVSMAELASLSARPRPEPGT